MDEFFFEIRQVFSGHDPEKWGEDGSGAQKRSPAPSPDAVGPNKTCTSAIVGRSRWEDCIVSHIRRSCFHSRSLAVTSSLSSGLFERIGLCLSMSKNDDELIEFIADAAMGRRENQENSGYTSCRRDQDLHLRWYMVFVFVCTYICTYLVKSVHSKFDTFSCLTLWQGGEYFSTWNHRHVII
jgi:hypothetical protein